jgi:hypothetical protein
LNNALIASQSTKNALITVGYTNVTGGILTFNEMEHTTYSLEFKRVSDTGERYVSATQKLAEIQHLVVTQVLKKLFEDAQWTVM